MQTSQCFSSPTSPLLCHSYINNPNPQRWCFDVRFSRPIKGFVFGSGKVGSLRVSDEMGKDGIFMGRERGRLVVVGANRGGGGGWGDGDTKRALGNLTLAIGLTYLSMTGQLGWLLDAVVSIWLIAVLLPVIGLGAFIWFAGRDMLQDSCPNCGNTFQILKSSLKDGVQVCPYCTQPFSVQDNRFVRESSRFSSNSTSPFEQVFNGFTRDSGKEKAASTTVVDIEAEVKDV